MSDKAVEVIRRVIQKLNGLDYAGGETVKLYDAKGIYIYIYIYIYDCINLQIYVYMHVCICVYIHTNTCINM